MTRLWALAAVVLAAVGGAASARFPLLAVIALGAVVAAIAVTGRRAAATALLLPLCILPYAIPAAGLMLGPSDALVLIIGAALLFDWAIGEEPGPLLGPLVFPAIGFVAWAGASVAWADETVAVLVETAQRAAFVLLGLAVVRALPSDGSAARAALSGLVGGCAVLGGATVVTGLAQGRFLHVYTLGMHKNWLGFVLSFGLVTAVAFAFVEPARSARWAGVATPIALGLLMSGSRGGWIGTLAGTAVIVLFQRPAFGFPALTAAAVVIALLFVAAPGLTTERIDTSTPDTSAGTRLRTWSSGVEAVRQDPLLGQGAGNFRAVVKDRGSQVDPNNLTLLTWAETGIFGLLFLIWLVVATYRLAAATARSAVSGTLALANTAGAAIFTAAMVHAQVDMFWTRGIALATFMAAGLILWSQRHRAVAASTHPRSVEAVPA